MELLYQVFDEDNDLVKSEMNDDIHRDESVIAEFTRKGLQIRH